MRRSDELEASEPFLQHDDGQAQDRISEKPSRTPSIHKTRNPWIILHLILIVSYSLFFLVIAKRSASSTCPTELLVLPAREALVWELRRFRTSLVDNSFTGEPRPELDEAWHDLVKSLHFSDCGCNALTSY